MINPFNGLDKKTLDFVKDLGKYPAHVQQLKLCQATVNKFKDYFNKNRDLYDYSDLIHFAEVLWSLESAVNECLDNMEFPDFIDLSDPDK